jgi:hypothetical protein
MQTSSTGPVANWTLECDNTHIHRYYTVTWQRNKKQKESTKYDQINYKYPSYIKTTIHMKHQWPNCCVKYVLSCDLFNINISMLQTVNHKKHSIVNILILLVMALVAVTCLAGLLQLLKSTYNKLYAFFWVIPWRLNFICRHFRTLSHLHRRVGMKND